MIQIYQNQQNFLITRLAAGNKVFDDLLNMHHYLG